MKNNLIKSIIGLICFTLVFSIISPSLAQATESQDLQINNSFSQETLVDNEIDKEEINDFLYSEEDFQDTLPYEEALAIYQNKLLENSNSNIEPSTQQRNLFRLVFSVVRSGVNYVVKVTSKGKKIKDVRNGKLEVDVSKHINANNRFKDYGSMDKLVKYIVEDIRRTDVGDLIKDGHNSIKTLYGKDKKLLEIRFYVEDGKLLSFNAFPAHSARDAGNVIWLVPQ